VPEAPVVSFRRACDCFFSQFRLLSTLCFCEAGNGSEAFMVTKVKCVNPNCQNYSIKKSVVSAGVLGMNYRQCAACGGKIVAAERVKPARRPRSRSTNRRASRRRTSGRA
jgi:hypothetical protein